MATLAAIPWADDSLHTSQSRSPKSYGRVQRLHYRPPPLTPLAEGTRRISGKRKRISGSLTTEHPLQSSPLATPYVPYEGAQLQQPRRLTNARASPSPLVCEKYQTRPGWDTPDVSRGVRTMHLHDTPDLSGCRAGLDESAKRVERADSAVVAPLEREGNGRIREPGAAQAEGWTQSAFGLVGGVASFLFRMLPALPSNIQPRDSPDEAEDALWTAARTPLPGMYPEDNGGRAEYFDDTPIRPNKRLHVDSAKSWIMVDCDRDDFTARLSSRKMSSNMAASMDSLRDTTPSSASRASSRQPPLVARTRHSTSHTLTHGASWTPSQPRSPSASQHKRRASAASMRSPVRTSLRPRRSQQHISVVPMRSTPDLRDASDGGVAAEERDSLTPEAHRYLQQRDRRDRDADRAMRKMSRQVRDLIRQGQQALGSNFEADGESGDEIEL